MSKCVVFVALLCSGLALAKPVVQPTFAVETHGAGFNSGSGGSLLGISFGGALRGGIRNDRWGLFLHVENDVWGGTNYDAGLVPGVVNVGLGGEHRFANGLIRTAVAFGTSTLVFDTVLDKAGSTGLFLDVRPLGIRWQLGHSKFTFGIDPIGLTFMMPVLSGLPLVRIQFRTSFMLEFTL
ncbi:MAG: hypothetical protein ACO1OB_32780 [Archangium sp.]